MIYPVIPARLVFAFFESKGLTPSWGSASAFSVRNDDASPMVSVDTEADWIDLNLLFEAWTEMGSLHLAEELIQWLGANPNY